MGVKWIADINVEQSEYMCGRKGRCPNSPVVLVSWYEAEAFGKWLTVK